MPLCDAENLNYLWAQLLFEEWRRQGLRHAIVCPDSRSSPLAIAAARTVGLNVVVATDERCAGFIALGVAKSSGVPAVVVTTSGTAVANLVPAAVEASMSGVPMLLVTADRPPELRECGANQAITQPGIFGVYARWSFEIPCSTSDIDASFVLSTADEAWFRSTDRRASGPVHLNWMVREPLAPVRTTETPLLSPAMEAWRVGDRPWRVESRSRDTRTCDAPQSSSNSAGGRGLIVCGETPENGEIGTAVAELARRLQWPVIADCGADIRTLASPHLVRNADLVLAAVDGTPIHSLLTPEVVLRVGGAVSSKRVNALVANAKLFVAVRHHGQRFDDRHQARVAFDDFGCDNALERLLAEAATGDDPTYLSRWLGAGAAADAAVDSAMRRNGGADEALSEPWIARALCRACAGHRRLVVGNSMPVRDVDAFLSSDAAPARITINRGASGIDGLVSTAVGCGIGAPAMPVTLLLGDLSLLHDLGGLANIRSVALPLHIVVVNNDGGGIFHFLPVAEDPNAAPHFEKLFGTPHGLSFELAAAMFSLEYRRVRSRDEAERAFAALGTSTRPTLIECLTDRRANVAAHRAVQRAVSESLAKELA